MIDYRYFDAVRKIHVCMTAYANVVLYIQKKITPRFEFGFGLSYTKFSYRNLNIKKITESDHTQSDLESAWDNGQASPIAEGSSTALW
jgi:hypothetical protein